MSFARDTLAFLNRVREIDIETHSAAGARHRVPIWVVVDGEDVFVRTYLGKDSRWYRELLARPGALVAGARRIEVRAARAVDDDSIKRTSDGYRKKYGKSGSLQSMLRRDVLETTLRLEPVS